MAKKEGFYRQTPAVPDKKIAGTNPIGAVVIIGGMKPPTVPQRHLGTTHAFGPQARQIRPKHVAHGYGHPEHAKKGHLRMSGNPGAHQIGVKGNPSHGKTMDQGSHQASWGAPPKIGGPRGPKDSGF